MLLCMVLVRKLRHEEHDVPLLRPAPWAPTGFLARFQNVTMCGLWYAGVLVCFTQRAGLYASALNLLCVHMWSIRVSVCLYLRLLRIKTSLECVTSCAWHRACATDC